GDSQAKDASQKQRIRAVTAASIGNFVEWYDFAIYGYLAVYIGQQFFPSENETTLLLASVAAIGTVFIFRLLGVFVLVTLDGCVYVACIYVGLYVSIFFSASWCFCVGTIGRSYRSPKGACPGDCTNVWDNLSHRCPPHLWGHRGIGSSPACSCQVCPGILCRW